MAFSEKLNFSIKFRYSEEAIKIRNNLPLNFVITMVFKIKRWDIFFKFLGLPTISEFYASLSIFAEKLSLRQRFDQRFGDGRALCLGYEL